MPKVAMCKAIQTIVKTPIYANMPIIIMKLQTAKAIEE